MTRCRAVLPAIAGLWLLAVASPTSTYGQQTCWPTLFVKQPRLSDSMINLKRYWFASLEVDASSCVESSGAFDLRTTRTKENGRDFFVTEPVAWSKRQTDIVIELWTDEAIIEHWIVPVRPCTCRN
jgi:hypothetical protein